eukprot:CAMPEP_0119074250 /NCGR_PEP_ID=MMETSP1178-20130426/71994_1 /TAXON_ID=33656 /ORGANISM="unid sp, Strain CCMP2000" /LENGTH=193 /DNA_ID=CAMNT_0007056393 /DNA_START=76 /DNA_END=655 /DNA_ORIENTATION=-
MGTSGVKGASSLPLTSIDLSDELNLNGHVSGQRVGAHGRARVDAALAENGAQELRTAVEDLGLLREFSRTVDEADHLDDPLHAVEVAQLVLERGEQLKRDYAREGGPLLSRVVHAHLTHLECTHVKWVAKGDVPSSEDEIAASHGRNVEPQRLRHAGKRVTQFRYARFGVHQSARQDAERGASKHGEKEADFL